MAINNYVDLPEEAPVTAVISGPVEIEDTAGNPLTSTAGSLNVNITNATLTLTYDTNYGIVGANTLRTASEIGNATGAASFNAGLTTPQTLRVVLPTDQTSIPVAQSGVWTTGRTWDLSSLTDSVNVGNFPSTFIVNQGTNPWVISGTVAATQSGTWNINNISGTISLPTGASTSVLQITGNTSLNSIDSKLVDNYGVASAALRTAAQIGNTTGQADFNAGITTAQTLRVVLPTDQTSIPVTQSGTWSVGRTWNLSSITDSVSVGNFPSTFIVTQGTSPWVVSGTVTANIGTTGGLALDTTVSGLLTDTQLRASPVPISGTVTANAGTGNFTVVQSSGANLHVNVDNFPADADALAQGSTTLGQLGALVMGAVTTNAPSYTTAQTNPLSLDTSGLLRISLKDSPSNTNKFLVTADPITFAAPQDVIIDSGTITTITNPVTVNQGTSPWVVSGAVTLPYDTNYGTVGANTLRTAAEIGNSTGAANFNYGTVGAQTLRTAAQIGNATGAAAFGAGTTTAQTLRVVLPTDQTSIPIELTHNGIDLDYNFSFATAQTLRVAALIGNGNGAADFGAGAASAQTLRVTASNFPTTVDTNFGAVSASTIRAAAQIGNATGAADFNAGATGAQTLRVTANAGTNLNTSLLALESGGNLASIKANTDNLNLAQGTTTFGQHGNLILAAVTTLAPSYTNNQSDPLSLTLAGGLRQDLASVGGTNISTGTGASGAGIPRVTVSNDSNVLVTQSGTWTDISDGPVTPGTVALKSSLMGGQFNTVLPVLTNAQQVAIQVDSSGRLIVAPLTSTSIVTVSNFPTTLDTNYGTVGANTLRTASEIGNATGAANFGNGATDSLQTLRVVANQGTFQGAWTVQGDSASGAAKLGNPVQIGGVFNTTQPTVVSGNTVEAQSTSRGALIVATAVDPFLLSTIFNTVLPVATTGQSTIMQGDSNGRLLTVAIPGVGVQKTYSASATFSIAALATDIFTITGSASKTIVISSFTITGTATSATVATLDIVKRSTANTVGTPTTITNVASDSANAASTATVLSYAGVPTTGTLVGAIRSFKVFLPPPSGGTANSPSAPLIGPQDFTQSVTLRGTGEVLAFNIKGVTIAGASFSASVEWIEF